MDAIDDHVTSRPQKLIPLAAVPKLPWLPDRGKPTHLSTVYRWATVGRGGHKLRTVVAGGRCTTETWLMEFFEAVADVADASPPAARSPAERRRQVQQAERRLKSAGL